METTLNSELITKVFSICIIKTRQEENSGMMMKISKNKTTHNLTVIEIKESDHQVQIMIMGLTSINTRTLRETRIMGLALVTKILGMVVIRKDMVMYSGVIILTNLFREANQMILTVLTDLTISRQRVVLSLSNLDHSQQ